MEVICEHCNAKLNLPEEKIPKDQVVRVTCPKCKKKMVIDTRKEAPSKLTPAPSDRQDETDDFRLKFIESKADEAKDEAGYSYDDYTDDKDLDFFEEGTKLVLVLENSPEHREKIKKEVEALGYTYVASPDTRDATGKMRFYHFDLIVLSDGYDGQQLERSPVLNYLNRTSMSVRRRIFVALLGDRFKTMDNMMSFALSANVVVNKKDLERLGSVLKKAISDNEKFFKVLNDELAELGRI